jgi:excisionase family DNA binding protein
MDDLLTAREVQDILKLDRITIYRMLQDGRLRGTKVGQQWRFAREEVARLAGSKKNSPAHDPAADSGLPVHCIQTIQDLFSDVSKIGSLYVSMDGTPVTQISRPCRFCQAILSSPSGRKACQSSWQETVQNSRRSYVTCHAGLQYVGAPVSEKNGQIGLFITGQFYLNPPDPGEENERTQRLASEHQIPVETLRQAAAAIPRIEPEQRSALEAWPYSAARAIESILRERAGFMNRLQQIADLTQIS